MARGRSALRRRVEVVVTLLGATAALALLALVAARLAGQQVLIERSDSMRPAIAAGDLLLTQRIRPAQARRGDIVTFAEPGGAGRTITHRVVAVREQPGRLAFVTRGDANSGVERWSVARRGTIGRTLAVVPKAGFALDWLSRRSVRFAFVALAGVLAAAMLIHRIWAA